MHLPTRRCHYLCAFWILTAVFWLAAQTISFDDTDGDSMSVAVSGYYKVSLSKDNGAILAITDLNTNTILSMGSVGKCLWKITCTNLDTIAASSYSFGGTEAFSYSFTDSVLTMTYTPSLSAAQVPVSVTLTAHKTSFFDFQLTLVNNSSTIANLVKFPNPLQFEEAMVTKGIFPEKPGMMLSSEWFTTDLPLEGELTMVHPPLMSDFLALQMGSSGFAQYAVWKPGPIRVTQLGYLHVDGTTGSLLHDYNIWRPNGYSWQSPPVRFRISPDVFQSIQSYRVDNGIDQFESVAQKLGGLYDTVITSPMFAWDGDWFGEYTGWGDFFDMLPKPGILFTGNYWPGGFHGHHPDLLPPDPEAGTEQEFIDAISYARQTGLIPLTMNLPSWWHEESPTIQNLSLAGYTIEDIAQLDSNGNPDRSFWELAGVKDYGYSVSPRAPYVLSRTDQMMNDLRDAGFELIYEDVIGACSFGPDFNASAPDTIDSERWIDHTRTYKSYGLLTETGYDYLAETQVGFLGGGAGPSWSGSQGSSISLFPFTGFLLRDKVLHYHYWANPTDNLGAFSWNLTFGYMLGSRVNPSSPTEGIGSPWHKTITAFQSRVLSRYATVLLTDFEELTTGNGIKCEYGTITVVANRDTSSSLTYGNHRLPPEGVMITSASGDLIAGVMEQLNGAPLTAGDHYLIIEAEQDTIFIRQLMGDDTPLRLTALSAWSDQDSICVTAWDPDTNLIKATMVRVQGDTIGFSFRNIVDGQHVGWYKIYKDNSIPTETWTSFYNDYELPYIILGNRNWYELYIAKFNGGIAGIVDKTTGDTITTGTGGGILWKVEFPNDLQKQSADPVHGFDEDGFAPHQFTYSWNPDNKTLTLQYAQDTATQYGLDVTVSITISEEPYFDMKMSVKNDWGSSAQLVHFPYDLHVPSQTGDKYILPYSYPGLEIDAGFFDGTADFQAVYPADMLADYVAFLSSAGSMSIYGLHQGDSISRVEMGLVHGFDAAIGNFPAYRHTYQTEIDKGLSWNSPKLRFRIGQNSIQMLSGMRTDNSIDEYQTASGKLDNLFTTVAQSPLVSVCFEHPTDPQFFQIAPLLQNIPGPAAVMLAGFQTGGMEGYHPNYLPPDGQWGTEENFNQMIRDIHNQGKLIIPYTTPNWWHQSSPSVQGLASIDAVAQLESEGTAVQETIGDQTGYRISPYGTGVLDTLARMFNELKTDMGADLVMAARLKSRTSTDYNPNAPSPFSFNYGWIESLSSFSDSLIIVENGYDRMASVASGFSGSMYEDISSGSTYWDEVLGAGNWRSYPAGPALLGDKIIAFQPMEKSLTNKDILSFSLLNGMSLSFRPQDGSPDRPYTSPWLKVASTFQEYAGSRIAGKLLTDYTQLTSQVSRAVYNDITVIRNESASEYVSGSHTIVPYGALLTDGNGDLVAGILNRYNGVSLSAGDHYLVIQKSDSAITVHHPMGPSSDLGLARPAGWTDSSQVFVFAVLTDNSKVNVSRSVDESTIKFKMVRSIGEDSVSHFVIDCNGLSTKALIPASLLAFRVFQCQPNPFSRQTVIRYHLPDQSRVLLRVFNVKGQEVRKLIDEVQKPGRYTVTWDGNDKSMGALSSGIYFYELRAGNRRKVLPMIKRR